MNSFVFGKMPNNVVMSKISVVRLVLFVYKDIEVFLRNFKLCDATALFDILL